MPKPSLDLIFVHVAKAGGSSMRVCLSEVYGDRLYHDYFDGPSDPSSRMNMDPEGFLEYHRASAFGHLAGKAAVIGHLWIRKYDGVDARVRAVVLRDPIVRAFSNYWYWIAADGVVPPVRINPLRRYMIDNGLTFEQFARTPVIRWFYTRQYFRDTDMRTFDFIGETRRVHQDWSGTMRAIGVEAPRVEVNRIDALDPGYEQRKGELLADAKRMARLRDLFADDIDFFERHTAIAAVAS